MRPILPFLFCLLLAHCLHAQSPRLSLLLGAGTWRDRIDYIDNYASEYPHWQAQAGIGLGTELSLSPHFEFAPEVGLEFYNLRYRYVTSSLFKIIDARLGLFYARLSPGITWHPSVAFSIRLGLPVFVSAFTTGKYDLIQYDPNTWVQDTLRYKNSFGRIRNPLNWGPELSLGLKLIESRHGGFGIRLSSFLGMGSIFRKEFPTPLNPRMFQTRLEVCYTLPHKKDC